MQGNMFPNTDVPAEEVARVAKLVQELGDEWDRDCSLAFEVGQFDIDRATWIAQGIAKIATHWVPAVQYWTRADLRDAVQRLSDYGYSIGSDYGLPEYDEDMDEMIGILAKTLKIKVTP